MISGELVMRVENIEATVGFSCHSDPSESNYELITPTCFKVDVGRPVAFHDARVGT